MPLTKTYIAWKNMRQRCSNTKLKCYPNYGGRGITVCERWNVYQNFLDDMGEAPHDKTLERVKNEEGYSPGNCVWEDRTQQNANRRFSGVGFDSRAGKWRARVARYGKKVFLGYFNSEEEAIEARKNFLGVS